MGGVSPLRTLVLVSPAYFPPPSDWPTTTRMTGFTIWDGSVPTPPEVDAFLAAGDVPVVVTMGTGAAATAEEVFAAAAETLDGLGLRGLYLVAHDENRSGVLADRDGCSRSHRWARSCRGAGRSCMQGATERTRPRCTPARRASRSRALRPALARRRTQELGIGRLAHHGSKRPAELRVIMRAVTDDGYATRAVPCFAPGSPRRTG